MCCSSYDYLSSKTSENLLGRGLVNIAVPAGEKGGQFLPQVSKIWAKFKFFGQNQNSNLAKYLFLEITMLLGRNFFSGQEFQTIFCPIHKVLENHDLGKRHKI